MADSPESRYEGFTVDLLPEGKLAISLITDQGEVGRVEGDGAGVADLVTLLLANAQDTHKAAGLRLPDVTQPTPGLPVHVDLSPSRVKLFRNLGQHGETALLILTFGGAQFSIAIPTDILANEPPERPDQMH